MRNGGRHREATGSEQKLTYSLPAVHPPQIRSRPPTFPSNPSRTAASTCRWRWRSSSPRWPSTTARSPPTRTSSTSTPSSSSTTTRRPSPRCAGKKKWEHLSTVAFFCLFVCLTASMFFFFPPRPETSPSASNSETLTRKEPLL